MHLLHAMYLTEIYKKKTEYFPIVDMMEEFLGRLARSYVIDFFLLRLKKNQVYCDFFHNTRKHVRKNLACTAITRNLLKVRDNHLFIIFETV